MFFDLSTQLKNWYVWFKSRELKEVEKIKISIRTRGLWDKTN